MANPIVVLPRSTVSNGIDGAGSSYTAVDGTKQSKPYNLPAPYRVERSRVLSAVDYGTSPAKPYYTNYANAASGVQFWFTPGPGMDTNLSTYRTQALNLARDKFVEAVRSEAMLAVNWAERHQAVEALTKRLDQLVRFTSALRRKDPRGALAALGQPPSLAPKGRRWARTRSVADQFLEFHFGWVPLVEDIHTSFGLLCKPFPAGLLVEVLGKKVKYSGKDVQQGPNWHVSAYGEGYVRASIGAEVSVSNPNLWILNQLGLLNPLGVAWELTPWSFVFDWFYNMGNFLNQWTDFVGLSLINSWNTVGYRSTSYSWEAVDRRPGYPNLGYHIERWGSCYVRTLGMPGVTLGRLPPKRLSIVRGLTAASLLVQRLPSRESPTRGVRNFTPRWAA